MMIDNNIANYDNSDQYSYYFAQHVFHNLGICWNFDHSLDFILELKKIHLIWSILSFDCFSPI